MKQWDRESPDAPAHGRNYGSPTVLVDGRDVAGDNTEVDANSCRVYVNADGGFRGSPSADMIRAALI